MTGGITLASAFVPSLPLTVFEFDSAAALSSVGGSLQPSKAAPFPRAFSACSLFGVNDYFVMYASDALVLSLTVTRAACTGAVAETVMAALWFLRTCGTFLSLNPFK